MDRDATKYTLLQDLLPPLSTLSCLGEKEKYALQLIDNQPKGWENKLHNVCQKVLSKTNMTVNNASALRQRYDCLSWLIVSNVVKMQFDHTLLEAIEAACMLDIGDEDDHLINKQIAFKDALKSSLVISTLAVQLEKYVKSYRPSSNLLNLMANMADFLHTNSIEPSQIRILANCLENTFITIEQRHGARDAFSQSIWALCIMLLLVLDTSQNYSLNYNVDEGLEHLIEAIPLKELQKDEIQHIMLTAAITELELSSTVIEDYEFDEKQLESERLQKAESHVLLALKYIQDAPDESNEDIIIYKMACFNKLSLLKHRMGDYIQSEIFAEYANELIKGI